MTIEELKNSNREFLYAADIAPILHADPQCIRRQAQVKPEALGFPVSVIGSRCKIPRKGFLRFVEGGNAPTDIESKDFS